MSRLQNITRKVSGSIFFNHIKTIDDHITALYEQEEGWCSNKEFSKILQMEIRRSYRTGSPLSYVVIDLLGGVNGKYALSSKIYAQFLNELIQLVSKNTREFDVRSVSSAREIGIILIDTAVDGARIFTQKITDEICKYFQSLENDNYENMLSYIKISTYPLNKISGNTPFVAKPNISKDQKQDQYKVRRSDKVRANKEKNVDINWNKENSKESLSGVPNLLAEVSSSDFQTKISYTFVKRMIDLLGAFIGIILFLPLMFFISIVVKFTSPGPILFRQKRIGYKGKQFTFLKFRTMRIGENEGIHKDYVKKLIEGKNTEINMGTDERPTYKITDDPRITNIGHILRKTSLDELPQLLNVLIGQMSLVGPRPPIPYEVEMYKTWHLQRILEVKPGVTGLWQVEGRSSTTFDEMVRMDLQYVRKKSILMDIKIIIKTFFVVFKTEGAV
jgi:lipopolysaccharide/colanic/teichoic acid biosynthesis glycosyltransferase